MKRVLIIGSDGMRPDAVTPELMPTYSRLIKEGMLFTHFHAAYPSETRVSMTTLTTGVYPGKHGIVANSLYIPGFRENGTLQTGNHEHLMECLSQTGEPAVLRPTLGDRLHAVGRHLAVAGSSSPGAGLLWNINHPEKVINVNSSYGVPEMEGIYRQIGTPPPKENERERLQWAVKALIEIHLPDPNNEALVLWLNQPDKASHQYGPGSPEHCESLRWVDHCLAEVLQAIEHRGDTLDLFLISDHGHSTINAQGKLQNHLETACRELGIDVPFSVTGKSIHNKAPISDEALENLIEWLKKQPWCGALFTHHARASEWGALPIETLLGPLHHGRAPLLIINPTWSPECNEYGAPGIVDALVGTNQKATHGHAIPTDMQSFCLGYGPSFKERSVSDVPCGIVDIAPTVCHLLNMNQECGFDGRVLHEGLQKSATPKTFECIISSAGEGTQRQPIQLAEVNGTRYILGSEASIA